MNLLPTARSCSRPPCRIHRRPTMLHLHSSAGSGRRVAVECPPTSPSSDADGAGFVERPSGADIECRWSCGSQLPRGQHVSGQEPRRRRASVACDAAWHLACSRARPAKPLQGHAVVRAAVIKGLFCRSAWIKFLVEGGLESHAPPPAEIELKISTTVLTSWDFVEASGTQIGPFFGRAANLLPNG